MMNKMIGTALLGSALLLGTGLMMTRIDIAQTSGRETAGNSLSANLLSGSSENQKSAASAGTLSEFILSTVSADFALPGRIWAA